MVTLLPMPEADIEEVRATLAAEMFEAEAGAITGRSPAACRRLRARLDRLGEWARAEWRTRALTGWGHPDVRRRAAHPEQAGLERYVTDHLVGREVAALEDHLLAAGPRPAWFSAPASPGGLLGALAEAGPED